MPQTTAVTDLPAQIDIAPLDALMEALESLLQTFDRQYLHVLFDSYGDLAKNMAFRWRKYTEQESKEDQDSQAIFNTLEDIQAILKEFESDQLPVIGTYLETGIVYWLKQLEEVVLIQPESIMVDLEGEDLMNREEDGPAAKMLKRRLRGRMRKGKKISRRSIRFQRLVEYEIGQVYFKNLLAFFHALEIAGQELSQFLGQRIGQRMDTSGERGAMPFSSSELKATQDFLSDQHEYLLAYWREFHALFRIRIQHEVSREAIRAQRRAIPAQHQQVIRQLQAFGKHWQTRQTLYHQHPVAESYLLEVYAHLEELGRQVQAEVDARCFAPAKDDLMLLAQGLDQLEKITNTHDWEKVQSLNLGGDNLLLIPDSRIMESAIARLRYLLDGLPNSLTMWQRQLDSQGGRVVKVDLSETLSFLTKTYFLAPLEAHLFQLPEKFKAIFYQHQDATRLISLNMTDTSEELTPENRQALLERARQHYDAATQNLVELQSGISQKLEACLWDTVRYLHADELVSHARQWERNRRNQEAWQGFRNFNLGLKAWSRKQLDRFWRILGQTRSDLLLSSRENGEGQLTNVYTLTREFVEARMPGQELLEHLPFYYKQLFTGVQSVNTPQIPNREAELTLARRAARVMEAEGGGAILLTGEALSGKSFFAEYVATHLLGGNLYRIQPPPGGSRRVADLTTAVQRATGLRGSLQQILPRLEPGAVILMSDIELWWERSRDGMGAFQRLLKLIDTNGRRLNFVADINIHAFRLLRNLTDLEGHFAATINMSPFSADQLRKTVMERHYSGGGELRWADDPATEISGTQLGRLFRRYLRVSGGNIGVVLRLWLGHIEKYDSDKVFIRRPEGQRLPPLPDPDWEIILAQLVLHKYLTYEQIQRVLMLGSKSAARRALLPLLRTGLVREVDREVLEVNPYVYAFIVQRLRENQIL